MAAPPPSAPTGIPVWNPEGELVSIPALDQAALLQGYRAASPDEVHDAQQEAQYGGAGQGLAAAAEGAASALTFGVSPKIETSLGITTPEAIQSRKEVHPILHGLGTAAGIAGPLIATAGAAAPLEGAAAAAEAAPSLARGVAELTAPALIARAGRAAAGAAERAGLPGVLGRAAPTLAMGAAEGALYSGADVTEKALLGDPQLTWEKAASELGLGALFGGALAGGTVAATKGLGAILRKSTEGLSSVASHLAKGDPEVVKLMLDAKEQVHALEQVAPGAADSIAGSTPETARFILRNRARIERLEGEFPGLTDILARASPDTGKEILDNWGKLLKDPQARIDIGNSLTEAVNTSYQNIEGALRTVNKDVRPAEIERLTGGVDQGLAQQQLLRLHGMVDALAKRMRAEPDLFQPSAARELELIREGMARDAVGLAASKPNAPASGGARESRVITPQIPDGEPVRYGVMEADRLVPSHSPQSFTPTEGYPQGVQERNYLGQPGEQLKVVNGAKNLNPALLLTDTPSALDGPPLVTAGEKPIVLGGNGRTMMVQRAFAEPEKREAYRKALLEKANAFGIPRSEIERLKAPVLVRVVPKVGADAGKAEMIAAVRRFNEGMTQQFSPMARAIAESKTLSPGTIESIGKLLGGERDASLRDVLRDRPESMVNILRRDGVINAQNEAQWLQGGAMTDQAKERIEGMFLGRVFESELRLSQTAPELSNKVERIAPALIKVAGQAPEYDQIGNVRGAIDLLNGARAKKLNLDDYLYELTHQSTMFSAAPAPLVRDAVKLAKILEKDGQRAVQARFQEWGDHLNPQTSLFAAKVRPSRESADAILFKGVAEPKVGSLAAKAAAAAPPAAKGLDAAASARMIYERAKGLESTTTSVMRELENKNAKLAGLEFAVKPLASIEGSSLKRLLKVKPDATQADATNWVQDALRYTLEIAPGKYVQEVPRALKALEEKGYTVETWKNFWGKDTYQGLNTVLKGPHGEFVELQFHTPESFAAKMSTHEAYSEHRLLEESARKRQLEQQMAAVQSRVPPPAGAKEMVGPASTSLPSGLPPNQVFNLLNRTKQLIDAQSRFGRVVSPEWRRTADALKSLRSEFKAALEDRNVWGAAGERQGSFNAAQNAYFTARRAITEGPANQKLMQKLVTRTGAVDYEANPRSVNSWINLMADGRGGAKSDSFGTYLKASRELAAQMEASGYPGGADLRRLIDDTVQRAGEIRQRGTITQLVKMLQGHEILSSGPAIPMGQRLALEAAKRLPGGVGHIVGGITGTIAKVRQPSVMIGVLTALDKFAKKASARLDSVADGVLSSGVGSAAAAGGAERFHHGGMVTPERFGDVSTSLRDFGGNLDRLAEVVSKETGHLQEHAPATADAAHSFAARVVQHLASKLPDPGPRRLLDPPFEPSHSEMAEYNRHHEVAARGPVAVLEHLARGTLHPSHVETSMALWPKMHEEARQLVAERLAAHLGEKKHVPVQLRGGLGLLLGSDLDHAMTPQAILSAQMAYQDAPAQSGQPAAQATGKPRALEIRAAERLSTGSQQSELRMRRA